MGVTSRWELLSDPEPFWPELHLREGVWGMVRAGAQMLTLCGEQGETIQGVRELARIPVGNSHTGGRLEATRLLQKPACKCGQKTG